MQLDCALSFITRRLARVRGATRLVGPLRKHYCRLYQRTANPWVTVRDFDGDLNLRIDRSAYIGSQIYWYGFYSRQELLMLDRLFKPDMVFLDIGANQGEFTAYAAKRLKHGRVIAFEPVAELFDQLRMNVEMNGFDNVLAYNCALSDVSGELDLFTSNDTNIHCGLNEGLSSLFPSPYRCNQTGKATVDVLDRIVDELKLSRVDVIKIDVEGSELAVLRGAQKLLQRYRPTLLMEINGDTFSTGGYTPADICKHLEGLGYSLFGITRSGALEPTHLSRLPDQCNVVCRPV